MEITAKALEGAWYRCGSDPQYPPMLGDGIYINGDGIVSAFTFANGHADSAVLVGIFGRFIDPGAVADSTGRSHTPSTANAVGVLHRAVASPRLQLKPYRRRGSQAEKASSAICWTARRPQRSIAAFAEPGVRVRPGPFCLPCAFDHAPCRMLRSAAAPPGSCCAPLLWPDRASRRPA